MIWVMLGMNLRKILSACEQVTCISLEANDTKFEVMRITNGDNIGNIPANTPPTTVLQFFEAFTGYFMASLNTEDDVMLDEIPEFIDKVAGDVARGPSLAGVPEDVFIEEGLGRGCGDGGTGLGEKKE